MEEMTRIIILRCMFMIYLLFLFKKLIIYVKHEDKLWWGRDGIVEETPVHVYYAYLKPT